jgi:hypothetical protein
MQDDQKKHYGERYHHPHQHSYWRKETTNNTHQAAVLPPHDEKKINPSGLNCTAKKLRFVGKSIKKKEEEDTTMVGSNAIMEKKISKMRRQRKVKSHIASSRSTWWSRK